MVYKPFNSMTLICQKSVMGNEEAIIGVVVSTL